jgi:bla regulator protein blaR1
MRPMLTLALLVPCVVIHAQASGDSPSFEVASVKPNRSGALARRVGFPADRFEAANVTLQQLIATAYGVPGPPPQAIPTYRIIGGPDWIDAAGFDIVAKSGESVAAGIAGVETKALMLRALLKERFGLVLHTEVRDAPVYVLSLAGNDGKLGPQIRRSELDCPALRANRGSGPAAGNARNACGSGIGFMGSLKGGAMTMTDLSWTFSTLLDRVVLDRTGLTGSFDVELQFNPEGLPGLPGPPGVERPPIDSPSLFTAIQEQLGLRLESTRGPVEVLVIDRAEQPTPD